MTWQNITPAQVAVNAERLAELADDMRQNLDEVASLPLFEAGEKHYSPSIVYDLDGQVAGGTGILIYEVEAIWIPDGITTARAFLYCYGYATSNLYLFTVTLTNITTAVARSVNIDNLPTSFGWKTGDILNLDSGDLHRLSITVTNAGSPPARNFGLQEFILRGVV